jgi:hypothetical protein
MIYNGDNSFDVQKAVEKLKYFIAKKMLFELKAKNQKKTIAQNNYFHLIVSYFAYEYGETVEYVKTEIVKKIVCPNVFKSEYANFRTGEIREEWRSFASLDKDETMLVIDMFRNYASKEAGIYLPEPKDLNHLQEIEKIITNNKSYL